MEKARRPNGALDGEIMIEKYDKHQRDAFLEDVTHAAIQLEKMNELYQNMTDQDKKRIKELLNELSFIIDDIKR